MQRVAEALARTPEPELMDSPNQVAAYAGADFEDSNARFTAILGRQLADVPPGRLIDLGCGPADICVRLARALPGWRIEGLDAGENMLEVARRRLGSEELTERVQLIHARLPEPKLDARAYDCVASNSLLHHLPDPNVLWRAIDALARPGAWIQVMDLARPDSAPAVEALVEQYAADEPEVLRIDFRNSLHAAWRVDEVHEQLRVAGLPLTCELVSDRHWLVSGRHDRPAGA